MAQLSQARAGAQHFLWVSMSMVRVQVLESLFAASEEMCSSRKLDWKWSRQDLTQSFTLMWDAAVPSWYQVASS